jgi:hypothetical protein
MERRYKIRKSVSRGSPSYQLGHYEMIGEPGKRRSMFVVDVHLGEFENADAALGAWPAEIARLRAVGRDRRAESLEAKLIKLQQLSKGGEDHA